MDNVEWKNEKGMWSNLFVIFRGNLALCEDVCDAVSQGEIFEHDDALARLEAFQVDAPLVLPRWLDYYLFPDEHLCKEKREYQTDEEENYSNGPHSHSADRLIDWLTTFGVTI